MNAPKPDARRSKLLARVHIARKALGLDEETYRAMLLNSFGADSAGKLEGGTLEQLVRALERSLRGKRPRGGYPGRPHNMQPGGDRTPQLQKIEALLAEAKRPWAYADALAQRICHVEKLAFVPEHELYKIIAALMKDAQRHGRDTG